MIRYNHTNLRSAATFAALLVLGTLLAPAGRAQGRPHTVQVENASSYSIFSLRLPTVFQVQSGHFGEDLLGLATLPPGYSLPLRAYSGAYVLLVEDGDHDFCMQPLTVDGNATWRVTNEWLLGCERLTATLLDSVHR